MNPSHLLYILYLVTGGILSNHTADLAPFSIPRLAFMDDDEDLASLASSGGVTVGKEGDPVHGIRRHICLTPSPATLWRTQPSCRERGW